MSKRVFKGTVVRVEPDGFGVVEFVNPLGSNNFGVFSSSTSSTLPYYEIKVGAKVAGTAEETTKDIAKVKTLKVQP